MEIKHTRYFSVKWRKYSGENGFVVIILLAPKVGEAIVISNPVSQNNVLNERITSCPHISNKFDDICTNDACEMEDCFDKPVVPDEHTMAAMWLSASIIVGLIIYKNKEYFVIRKHYGLLKETYVKADSEPVSANNSSTFVVLFLTPSNIKTFALLPSLSKLPCKTS